MIQWAILASFFLIWIAGCGVEQPPDTYVAAQMATPGPTITATPDQICSTCKPDLTGTWKQSCTQQIVNGTVSGSSITTMVVGGGVIVTSVKGYQSGTCTGFSATANVTSSFVIGNKLTNPNGAFEITNTVTKATLTPDDSTAAFGMNLVSVCGLTGWSAGVPKDIVGKTCQGSVVNSVDYNIFEKAGPDVLMGIHDATHDGSSAAKRPTTLDQTPYIKQ